jgi:hypothetical protein
MCETLSVSHTHEVLALVLLVGYWCRFTWNNSACSLEVTACDEYSSCFLTWPFSVEFARSGFGRVHLTALTL